MLDVDVVAAEVEVVDEAVPRWTRGSEPPAVSAPIATMVAVTGVDHRAHQGHER